MDSLIEDITRCSFAETCLIPISNVVDHKVAQNLKDEFRKKRKLKRKRDEQEEQDTLHISQNKKQKLVYIIPT